MAGRGSACLNGQGLKLESLGLIPEMSQPNWLKAKRAIREELTLYVPSLSDGPDGLILPIFFFELNSNFASILSPSQDHREKHGGDLHPQLLISFKKYALAEQMALR